MFHLARTLRRVSGRVALENVSLLTLADSQLAALTQGQTLFLGVGASGAESAVQMIAPFDAIVSNMQCIVATAPGVGQSFVCTFRVGGSDTGITATISGTATTASDNVNEVRILQGDLLSVKFVTSAGAASTSGATATFVMRPV